MADLQGTNVSAPVRPFSDQDPIPTFYSNEGYGGHHNVASIALRDAIMAERRSVGMTCFVEETGILYVLTGGLSNSNWQDSTAALAARTAAAEAAIAALQYVPMALSGFTATPGIAEVGATVTSLNFSWTRNRVPATLSISQGVGAITPTLTAYAASVSITAPTTYVLTADDGTTYPGHMATAQVQILFQHRMYWGTAAAASLDSAGILGLSNSAFATTRARSFTVSGAGQYIHFCYPASWGDASVRVNGFVSTAWTRTTVSFQNASGNTTNFYTYRSNGVQNGTLQIDII